MYKFYHKNKHHIINLVMVVVFIVFFGLGMLLLSEHNNPRTINTNAQTMLDQSSLMPSTEENEMTMATQDGATEYNVGDTVSVVVKGESSGHDINGYDVLLSYDPAKLEFVDTMPGMDQFQVFAFKHPTYISVTGTKLVTINAATVFHGEPLLVARFKAKMAGKAHFQIDEQFENEHSKMVDMQANSYPLDAEQTLDVTIR